ncbi:hypothetical protein Tco_1116381 [Tanacetum coccineum]
MYYGQLEQILEFLYLSFKTVLFRANGEAPPYIIDVVDEDDDIIDEEDPIPHDLADSNDEDLVNLDIDDGIIMSADVARGYGGDGGGDDHPPPHQIPTGCGGCLGNRGHPKTQFGWQERGQAAYPPGDPEPRIKGHHG